MKCYVSRTYEDFDAPPDSRARLVDCKEWSHNRDKFWEKALQELKEALKRHEGSGGSPQCIEPLKHDIERLTTMMGLYHGCKDDCTFCEIETAKLPNGEMDEYRRCIGPKDPRVIKEYPSNSCQEFGPNDRIPHYPRRKADRRCIFDVQSRVETSVKQNLDEDIDFEVCTCSTDGCKPPQEGGNPNPANPNPANPNPNSTNPNPPNQNPNPPNSNPSNTNDNTGTTDKNHGDPAAHPNIMSFLFTIASLLVIDFRI